MDDTVQSLLAKTLFRFIKQLDNEADTLINGKHAGLVNYSGHLGRQKEKWERPINDRLTELFIESGCHAQQEIKYPNMPRQKCDLVIDIPLIGKFWLEMKMAWKDWHGNNKPNSSFKGYLDGSSKTHSFAHDFEKLNRLTAEDGQYIGQLLIGFDSENNPMISTVLSVVEKLNLSSHGWQMLGPETWADRNCSQYRFHIWFFCKQLKKRL
jgi:hypothetical protein